MRQITLRLPCETFMLKTSFGKNLCYEEWCRYEVERMNNDGGEALIKILGGDCSIWTRENFDFPSIHNSPENNGYDIPTEADLKIA